MDTKTLLLVAAFAVMIVWVLSNGSGCSEPRFPPAGKVRCEGYWDEDYMPVPHKKPWCGKEEWMQKLAAIEAASSEEPGQRIQQLTFRGLATSRIDDSFLGNTEYADQEAKVCWTGDFREHYVGKYNCVPTKPFFDYVESFTPQV
ncbi:hypothetical protein DIPPA_06178 [Diplonema papillatum]|nr:hypothetical protein DIPPA_06178 [Diplonema papillatum]